jgi:iron complex outermembrane receptor protein
LLAGGPGFESEVLHAYELGYKTQPTTALTASVATFYDIYHKLRSVEMGVPAILANGLEGDVYGAEIEAISQPLRWWRVEGGYTFLKLQLRARPGSTDTTQENQEGDSPRHQFFVRSWMDLPRGVELDVTVRRVDELPHQEVPAYTAFDLRVAWKASKRFEFAIVGKDLFDPRHPEFGIPATRHEIQRGLYAKATCRF